MSRPKLLLFTDWYEPGFKGGGPIRSAVNFVREMQEDLDIFVFTGDRDFGDTQPYPGVETDQWISSGSSTIFYASPSQLSWTNIKRTIQIIAPDYIYLNSMYSRYFTLYPLIIYRLTSIKTQIVLAPRGMLQEGAMQYKKKKKKIFLAALSWLGILKGVRLHATDAQEKQDITRLLRGIECVEMIPNFSAPIQPYVPIRKESGIVKCIFISRIAPKKNLLFFLSLLNLLPAEVKELQLTIRGTIEDEDYWLLCKDLIEKLPVTIKVFFDGPVENHSVIPLLQQHHFFVLPTFGENFGHAIFEALTAGRPVLISDQTPWRDLKQQFAGWDLPLEDSAAFIETVEKIAEMDNVAFGQWTYGSWAYAQKHSENGKLRLPYKKLFS